MRRLTAISLFLMFAGSSVFAQSGTDAATSSPLNGNWNITGNRHKEEFPLLSMYLQVNGTKMIAQSDVDVRCPSDPRDSTGGRGGGLTGELAPDGSGNFTLKNDSRATVRIEVRGQVPPAGATTWNGEYTLIWPPSPICAGYQETKSFTAIQLPPLNGTFSGSVVMRYFDPPPPTYTGPKTSEAKFTIAVAQGAVVSHRLNTGDLHFDLLLTGTIHVKGSQCFSHGSADLRTESTHGAAPSQYSVLRGDFVTLRFAMDDESEMTVRAVFADPGESGLSVLEARVTGGKCDKQSFRGMLEARRR